MSSTNKYEVEVIFGSDYAASDDYILFIILLR